MDQLLARIRLGQHTALLGIARVNPRALEGLCVVRVNCNHPPQPLGPILEARHKVEQLLDARLPLLDLAADRVRSGLRRRILGEAFEPGRDGGFVEALNRLSRQSERPCVLIFEAVDAADDATLTLLTEVIGQPGRVQAPLLLVFRTLEPTGAAASLLQTLERVVGADAVIREAEEKHIEARAGASAPERVLPALPQSVLRVLRAGALVGSGFEAELVATLLSVSALEVLERLQEAQDLGVPVEDLGDGQFNLPESVIDELRERLLPSLAMAWHRRLAALLAGVTESPSPASGEASGQMGTTAPLELESMNAASEVESPELEGIDDLIGAPGIGGVDPTGASMAATAPFDERVPPIEEQRETPEQPIAAASPGSPDPSSTAPMASIDDRLGIESPPTPEPEPGLTWKTDPSQEAIYTAPLSDQPRPRPKTEPAGRGDKRILNFRRDEPRGEPARAAGHFAAAGEPDQAAERYLAAANQAANLGAYPQAIAYARKGLVMLEHLPMSPERRLMRIQLLADLGRFHWEVAGPGADFTLAGALALLEEAHRLVRPEDRVGLKTGIKSLIAGVCYDLGDPPALDRALHELTEASRMLQEAGDALGAARLLNDQAAVWVRLGNPVRAVYMLNESRKVYEERAEHDLEAMAELAETYHLLARLTFHVSSRPGLEAEAIQMGVNHARSAEAAYRQLGGARELGRVWETLGRLTLRSGDIQRAYDYLRRATEVQQRIGDMLGLARSTGALAEVLSAQGNFRDSMALLSESVELNLEKGSPLGLAYNRRSLGSLVAAAPPDQRAAMSELVRMVTERLTRAESMLGRIALPENEPA